MTFYLSIDQIEELHALQLRHYGGSPGLRDRGGLESAIARPAMIRMNGQRLEMTSKELEDLTLTVARGELDAEALAIWFRQRISRED